MTRNPNFSRVLYCVPTEFQGYDGGDLSVGTAAVNPAVLAGTAAIGANDAAGTATTCRAFTPVNASGAEGTADGIDYGTEAQNMAAQRLECTTLVDERPPATPGPDGTTDLIAIVYGQQ